MLIINHRFVHCKCTFLCQHFQGCYIIKTCKSLSKVMLRPFAAISEGTVIKVGLIFRNFPLHLTFINKECRNSSPLVLKTSSGARFLNSSTIFNSLRFMSISIIGCFKSLRSNITMVSSLPSVALIVGFCQ